jgi:hypothetical protein
LLTSKILCTVGVVFLSEDLKLYPSKMFIIDKSAGPEAGAGTDINIWSER